MEWKTFDNRCWWCGHGDLSGEHRYKKSDLEREYFSNTTDQKIVLCDLSNLSEKGQIIQGAKSKLLKFEANLCKDCNNSKSQPFDKAYDELIIFLKENESITLKEYSISLENIFGESWEQKKENLKKYFVKHLGCTLTDANIGVPFNLIDFLNSGKNLENLELVISQCIDRKEYLDDISVKIPNSSWIGCSNVEIEYNDKSGIINFLKYELYYRSFSFYIHLNTSINGFNSNFLNDRINLILYNDPNFKNLNYNTNQRTKSG